MIATASFARPSPKIMEKSFGYSSYLMIVTAAIMSEEHKMEQISMISVKFIFHGFDSPVLGSYFSSSP